MDDEVSAKQPQQQQQDAQFTSLIPFSSISNDDLNEISVPCFDAGNLRVGSSFKEESI